MELNSIITGLNWRMATKSFDPNKKIPTKDFDSLLEILRLTPSSYGLQPWKFVVVKDVIVRKKLQEAAHGQKQVVDASHLIILCVKTSLNQNDVNDYIERIVQVRGLRLEDVAGFKEMLSGFINGKDKTALQVWATKQTYIALGNLLAACAMARIDSCPMEGFDVQAYNRIIGLDKIGLTTTLVCPVGYRLEDAPEIKNKKVRFAKNELVIEI